MSADLSDSGLCLAAPASSDRWRARAALASHWWKNARINRTWDVARLRLS